MEVWCRPWKSLGARSPNWTQIIRGYAQINDLHLEQRHFHKGIHWKQLSESVPLWRQPPARPWPPLECSPSRKWAEPRLRFLPDQADLDRLQHRWMPLGVLQSRTEVPHKIYYQNEKRLEPLVLVIQRWNLDTKSRQENRPIFLLSKEHPISAHASASTPNKKAGESWEALPWQRIQ